MNSSWERESAKYIRAERRKRLLLVIVIALIVGFALVCLAATVFTSVLYHFWYEDKVIETVQMIVNKSYLIKP